MDISESIAELFDILCDRVAAGERVDRYWISERYPQFAHKIEELLPILQLLLEFGPSSAGDSKFVTAGTPSLDGVLGDFLLVRELGRGGMGVVYEAEQVSVGRRVALKILPFVALLHEHQLERFATEATAAARLQQESIVTVYSVGCERGIHFIAMQLIEGPSLAEVIAELRQERHPCDNEQQESADTVVAGKAEVLTRDDDGGHYRAVARIGREAAEALHYAHEHGVLHRDIKPSNLLLDKSGHVWIADFGLARVEDESQLTRTGDILGTLHYMSPEQATGQRDQIDARSDVYGLGATLYELATLKPVFDNADRGEVIKQVVAGNPVAPHKIDSRIPRPLSLVISKAMTRRLDERYTSAREMADDLGRFLNGERVEAKPHTLMRRAKAWSRRHRLASAAIAGLLVVALLLPISHHFFTRIQSDSQPKGNVMKLSKAAKVAATVAAVAIVTAGVNAKKPPKPPPVTVPNPSGLVVSAATENSITLEWTSGGGTTAGFIVAYKEGTTYPKSNLRGATVIPVGNVESYTVPDLLTDQIYSFRVCAVDNNGKRSSGVTVQGTTVSGAVPVAATFLAAAEDLGDRSITAGRLIRQADGKLLSPGTVGGSDPDGGSNWHDYGLAYVLRWKEDHTVDYGYTVDYEFGNDDDGAFDYDFGGPIGADHARDVVEQQVDGELKLVVVGSSDLYSDAWIARLNMDDGSFDTTFGNDGKVDFLFPERYAKFFTVVVLPDNSLLALGDTYDPPMSLILMKFSPNGQVDDTFGNGGYSVINMGEGTTVDSQVYVSSDDGGLLIAGSGRGFLSSVVYKIDSTNGTLDSSFGGGDGVAEMTFDPDGSESFLDLAFQTDGKIVVVGGASSTFNEDAIWNMDLFDTFSIARFNPDGSLDETFGDSGAKLLDFGVKGQFARVEVLSNGKIVAFGHGGTEHSDYPVPESDASTALYLARFNSNASLDLTFNGTGRVKFNLVGIAHWAGGMVVEDEFTYLVSAHGYDEMFGWTPCLGMVSELP